MNTSSSSRIWNNPPPPGTEFDDDFKYEEMPRVLPTKKDEPKPDRIIDRIDPYLKNPVYVGREPVYSSERTRYRSQSPRRRKRRSKSRERYRRSRSKSRSRSRRSSSRSRRRRHYSSSRSRSRSYSPYHSRHRRQRHNRRRYSRSYSNSRSQSPRPRSVRESRRSRSRSRKRDSRQRKVEDDINIDGDIIKEEDMKIEDDVSEEPDAAPVPFKNDGSFLEMFKKMQEEQQQASTSVEQVDEPKKPILPAFGKRRGGKVLKTGVVQKLKANDDESTATQDAWSIYMKEVRRYKEACCDDDSKTRPLVK